MFSWNAPREGTRFKNNHATHVLSIQSRYDWDIYQEYGKTKEMVCMSTSVKLTKMCGIPSLLLTLSTI